MIEGIEQEILLGDIMSYEPISDKSAIDKANAAVNVVPLKVIKKPQAYACGFCFYFLAFFFAFTGNFSTHITQRGPEIVSELMQPDTKLNRMGMVKVRSEVKP